MTRNDDDEFHSFSWLSHQINLISAMSAGALTMDCHDAGHLRSSLQSANKSAPAAVNCGSQGGIPKNAMENEQCAGRVQLCMIEKGLKLIRRTARHRHPSPRSSAVRVRWHCQPATSTIVFPVRTDVQTFACPARALRWKRVRSSGWNAGRLGHWCMPFAQNEFAWCAILASHGLSITDILGIPLGYV